jgi:hypothetical protein
MSPKNGLTEDALKYSLITFAIEGVSRPGIRLLRIKKMLPPDPDAKAVSLFRLTWPFSCPSVGRTKISFKEA